MPLIPPEHISELRLVAFPNPPAIFRQTNLTKTNWRGTRLNRVDANKNITPAFVFNQADLSEADFSKARMLHPSTKKVMGMKRVVNLATANPPVPLLKQNNTIMTTNKGDLAQKVLKLHLAQIFNGAGI